MQSHDPHHPDDSPIDDSPIDDTQDDSTDSADTPAPGEADMADDTDDAAYDVVSQRDVPSAPTTGDPVVDAAMAELAAAEPGSLAERIDAGERAHRVLQGRLSDLGGA
jgi:hypothetical protein